jgi:hypothetical protein
MSRMIDQIRENKVPSNMMQFAARGALSVAPAENLEILVHLAKHSRVFGELAKMTLAGWDLEVCRDAAANPRTEREVLDYLISPDNLRPQLLPVLLENKSVPEGVLAKMAVSATREQIEVLLKSPRVRENQTVLQALAPNPYLKSNETAEIASLLRKLRGEPAPAEASAAAGSPETTNVSEGADEALSPDDEKTVITYLETNAAEIAAEANKPFEAIGGVLDEADNVAVPAPIVTPAPAPAPAFAASSSCAAAAPARAPIHAKPPDVKRLNTVQKIATLDVKGRIQLALKGNKEERSLLIRDGTKVVALAVLEAPKLADSEVEKFASQKNVLQAVLRQIPLKRRFMKNYIVVRNLVANPRTPLDLSLGLMKNLMIQDLKNLSANKEVADTIRKMALRMFKQKNEDSKKK